MNIVIMLMFIILLITPNISSISSSNYYKQRLRNNILRILILKEIKFQNTLKNFTYFYKICYEKTITRIGEGVIDYSNLSEDEKTIIETVISLCY